MNATQQRIDPKVESTAPIDRLVALMASDMTSVDATILKKMDSSVPLIPELAGHLVNSGGKRLRPLLTLACAHMLGYSGDRHITIAAIVEFIHTATLLHDDVVDASDMRRGKKTANLIWGNQPSVLVGDFLFSRSFELMVEDGSLEILRILSNASSIIAEGEVMQMQATHDLSTDLSLYMDVIGAKTAALFAAACEVAAVISGESFNVQEALRDYGTALGIAFQIADDRLDYVATSETMGKAAGDDFRDGKVTLPVIEAYSHAKGDDRIFWQRVMKGEAHQQPGDFDRAVKLIEETGALDKTHACALQYATRARAALEEACPVNDIRDLLADAADFAVTRGH